MKKIYSKQESNYKYLIPISLIVFFVPLIVYMKLVNLSPIEIEYWTGLTNNADFFSYNKMIALIILTGLGILSVAFYFKNDKDKLKKTNIYIPMAIYALFIILSTLLAEHKSIAIFGFVDRYEGMFSLLSYLILMFITINIVNNEKSIKSIIYPLLASAIIIGVIGAFQYIGKDVFQTTFMKKLILPGPFKDQAKNLKFNFGKNTIYSTLYNTNYVGSYMALLFPITLTLLILVKDMKKKLIIAPITGLMFINLLGSNSRGGLTGAVFSVTILIIMLRKQIIKNWKIVIASVVILGIGFVGINKISDGRATIQIARLKNDIKAIFVQIEEVEHVYKVRDLIAQGDRLSIITTEETLNIVSDNGDIRFFDGNNEEIKSKYDEARNIMTLEDDRYKDYRFSLFSSEEMPVIEVQLKGYKTMFAIDGKGFKYFINDGITRNIEEVEYYGFEGKESLGSGRGYIWSRSIPMLKKSLVIGNGPDTFPIYFPQKDFVGRFNSNARENTTITDKPHNLYLQIGINTGLTSLLAFLGIIIMYLIQSVKVYVNVKFEDFHEIIGLAIFISIVGYMVTGIFNDSVVSVASVFWILLGLGISINMKLAEDK